MRRPRLGGVIQILGGVIVEVLEFAAGGDILCLRPPETVAG
jgi:hypothetical protein